MNQLVITIVFDAETRETNFSVVAMGGAQAHLGNLTLALGSVLQQAGINAVAQIAEQAQEPPANEPPEE